MEQTGDATGNAAAVSVLLVLPKPQRFQELARSFAEVHGHVIAGAGRIVADQRVVAHGWSGYAKRFRSVVLDWVVGEVSRFDGFKALLDAEDGYYPTMRIDHDWRMLPLADAYDAAQEERGDPRRAFRVMPTAAPVLEAGLDDAPDHAVPQYRS